MEIYCVILTYAGRGPFEIVFSALSASDAERQIIEQYPRCKIISIKELYAT